MQIDTDDRKFEFLQFNLLLLFILNDVFAYYSIFIHLFIHTDADTLTYMNPADNSTIVDALKFVLVSVYTWILLLENQLQHCFNSLTFYLANFSKKNIVQFRTLHGEIQSNAYCSLELVKCMSHI